MPAVTSIAPITGISRYAHRSEEHTSELQSQSNLVCRLLLEKKNEGTAGASALSLRSQSPLASLFKVPPPPPPTLFPYTTLFRSRQGPKQRRPRRPYDHVDQRQPARRKQDSHAGRHVHRADHRHQSIRPQIGRAHV